MVLIMSKEGYIGANRIISELALHLKAIILRIFIGVFIFALILFLLIKFFTESHDIHNTSSYYLASFMVKTGLRIPGKSNDKATFFYKNKKYKYPIKKYNEIEPLKISRDKIITKVIWFSLISLIISLSFTFILMRYFKSFNIRNKLSGEHIRGSKRTEDYLLSRLIKSDQKDSLIQLGTVPLIKDYEGRHISISGDSGAGKSQLLMSILEIIKNQKEKAIILDKNGEMIQHFYNPETDYILAPFDDRTEGWTPFIEGDEIMEFESIASSFIPVPPDMDESKKHWSEAPATVFSWLLLKLKQNNMTEIDDIFKAFIQEVDVVEKDENGDEIITRKKLLYKLLYGTLAELAIDRSSPEHAASVLGSLIPKIKSLYYLRGMENKKQLSLKKWLNNDKETGWLFIRVDTKQMDAVSPLVSAWIDIVIKGIVSLPKSSTRKIWAIIDELQSIDTLNTLKTGLFEGRKHGLRFILGFTSISELMSDSKYGKNSARAMMSMCATHVAFRSKDYEAAKWNADCFGEHEEMTNKQGLSLGTNDNISINEQREKRHLISPSEIQNLPDLTAFLSFSGGWPVAKIKTKYIDRPIIAETTVLRQMPPDADYSTENLEEEITTEFEEKKPENKPKKYVGEPLL